jgi:hypothetical protein
MIVRTGMLSLSTESGAVADSKAGRRGWMRAFGGAGGGWFAGSIP